MRQLKRVEGRPVEAVPQRQPTADLAEDPADELGTLAGELARAYGELVESHQRVWNIGVAEAVQKARTPREQAIALAESEPPDQVAWWTISQVMEHDPAVALATWERVMSAARQELQSGHRTAQALEWGHTPWDTARFLALRAAYRDDWRPRGGVEASLVDLLAQSFALYLQWSERLALYGHIECQSEDSKAAREGFWVPPRASEARWMAWCATQAEAAHRRFLTTLKTLQDLRRLPAMTITSVAQVNVAQQLISSQVNAPGSAVNDLSKSLGDAGPHRKVGG
jgi:hypothetical protein